MLSPFPISPVTLTETSEKSRKVPSAIKIQDPESDSKKDISNENIRINNFETDIKALLEKMQGQTKEFESKV